jgi:predicted nucleic acid-binding protein
MPLSRPSRRPTRRTRTTPPLPDGCLSALLAALDGRTLTLDVLDEFARYDHHQISFIDRTSAVLARELDIERVFAFDSDFATLGFTRVPVDTGEPTE